jgi:hypothetical protein
MALGFALDEQARAVDERAIAQVREKARVANLGDR